MYAKHKTSQLKKLKDMFKMDGKNMMEALPGKLCILNSVLKLEEWCENKKGALKSYKYILFI